VTGLPDRTARDEDAYVAAFRDSEDVPRIINAVTRAIDARRPRLAARLVGLLDGLVDAPPGSALARAQSAARLFVHHKPTPAENSWSALQDAWRDVQRRSVDRAKRRQRRALSGKQDRIPRVERDPRKRR